MKKIWIAGILLGSLLFAEAALKPNVILIMTDDQGYGDMSAHGNPVLKTPEIDKLRSSSVRFTDFHVAPKCTPTRGQLLTGIDAMRNGATRVCQGRSMVRREFKMMPQYFAEAGYATGMFGKWHLGDSYPHRPRFRGFQEVLSFRAWGITSLADYWMNSYFDPMLMHNGVDKKYAGYCTDIFFAEAMNWIEKCADKKKPFFVYLPTNTPHVPNVVAEEYSRSYVGKHNGKPIPDTFYGMIANIDENVGKLEAFLKKQGLRDNTILIYMSDNGTQSRQAKELYNAGMREKKGSVVDGGHRVPLFVRWLDGKLQHGSDIAELATVQDLLPTLMELCGLEGDPSAMNGTSLAGLLKGTQQTLPERMVVSQIGFSCDKWNQAVVMHGKWRLIGGDRLYHIADDPHQDRNVYDQFPEIARAMNAHYDQWYAEVRPKFETPRYIIIGSKAAESVILYASDWQGDYCDNRGGLTKANGVGYWDLIVDRAGTYEMELRRWPKESKKTFTEGFEGSADKGNSARPIVAANVQVADGNYTLDVADGSAHATFNIKLPKGKVKLHTALQDAKERTLCSAMYVYVKRLEDGANATLIPVSGRKPQGKVGAAPKARKRAFAAAAIKLATDDILLAGFEGKTYGGWKAAGSAFGIKPVRKTEKIAGIQGQGVVDTYLSGKGDKATGTLTSPAFKIERRYINLLIGGGKSGDVGVRLLVGGKPVKTATGTATKDAKKRRIMAPVSWDVSKWQGQQATIVIFDNHKGGWGHIVADHIFQSDSMMKGTIKSDSQPSNVALLSASLKVDSTHLVVPVANAKQAMQLGIYDGETLVQSFKVALPKPGEAHWLASYPLDHFGLDGKQIIVKPIDGAKVDEAYKDAFGMIRCGDDLPQQMADDYSKPYRNQFHASTRRGWNNDPNGLVYHNGKYHLYYQYNPFGIGWGNMHWGHFESTDLINWKEKPIALYQKTLRDMMFSGGGFVDFNNSAGLGKDTQFAAFTSTGRGECLAYSKDGGQTFTELPENPVVKHHGRDPKIIWYAPEQKWVMAVYNTEECAETRAIPSADPKKFKNANCAFYESKDLRKWTRTGAFTDPDRAAVHECPELFQLSCGDETKWIIYGAQNRYSIGHFDGETFKKEAGPFGSRHGSFYAAQTFSDVPDGRRIQIGWVRTANYLDKFPGQRVNQAFSLPHEMTLVKTPEGLRVAFNPVKEVEKLRGEELATLDDCKGELTEVVIEFEEGGLHELMINGIDASFEGKLARIFTDRTFNEIYADGGLYYEVRTRAKPKFGSTETGVKNGKIKSLKVYRLKSIWK